MKKWSSGGKLAFGAILAILALFLVAAGARLVLEYAGWPWNLMRDQVTVHAQETPPVGSVPGAVPYSAEPWSGTGAPKPPKTSTAVLEGERVYSENCQFCHGPQGRGRGPLAGKLRNAPDDLTSWKVHYRNEQDLFEWIARPGMIMPPFEHRLEDEEIWNVTYYIQDAFRPAGPPPWQGTQNSALGKTLYEALSCDLCHGPDRPQAGSGIPPTLADAGSKLKSEWVAEYLQAPRRLRWQSEGVRPTTRMPLFSLTSAEAEALAEHLSLRVDSQRFPANVLEGPGSVEEGKEAFETYQCRGCHTLNGEGNQIGPDLTDVGSRLQPDYLYQFLLDPQAIVPGTSMRNMDLWDDEARALVRYLQTLRIEATSVPGKRQKNQDSSKIPEA